MIKFESVSFKYGGSTSYSINNIDMSINKGEFVLLMGGSGSGKSTVTRCMNGLIPHFYDGTYEGRVTINGKAVDQLPIHEISQKVGSVFQDPRSQFFTVDTLSELVFTCENFGMERLEISKRLNSVSSELSITHLLEKSLVELSSGEKQKVAIGSVRMLAPDVLVLDEPSANLDAPSIEQLRKLLTNLKETGYTIIISEHRLSYLMNLVDKAYHFEAGRLETIYNRQTFLQLTARELREKGLRRTWSIGSKKLKKQSSKSWLQEPRTVMDSERPILTVEGLSYGFAKKKSVLRQVAFKAYAGEIIALVGANGAGKTTLARILSGIYKEKSGRIMLKDTCLEYSKRRRHMSFVMQDADYQLFTESVEMELTVGNEHLKDLPEKIQEALTQLDLQNYKGHHPAALSGGQKQRVTISMAHVQESDIVIMDEPTSGLDRRNMERVCHMARTLALLGKVVLIISHDDEFILEGCHRVLYMKNGCIEKDFKLNDATHLEWCLEDMKKEA